MSTQTSDLHRSLLRPFLLHTLRAAGFHSTKPSVLDTLLNLTERYLLLLATATATHALNNHNDPVPTITDVRLALQECGLLSSLDSAVEETWTETFRAPVEAMQEAVPSGGAERARAEKRKREDEDVSDVRRFERWFEGREYAEIKRVAGMSADAAAAASAGQAVAKGGGGWEGRRLLDRAGEEEGTGGRSVGWERETGRDCAGPRQRD